MAVSSDKKKALVAAIEKRQVLRFSYKGSRRLVEPQTYGLSTARKEVLRAYERTGRATSRWPGMAKLFEVAKISRLEPTGETFAQALPAHNPNDSAMVEIFATLPKPASKSARG